MRSKWLEIPEETIQPRDPNDFDPNDDLDELKKLPHAEKKIELPIYKEKLEKYKTGIAQMHKRLIEAIRNDPDIAAEELYGMVEALAKRIGLDEDYVSYVKSVVDKYVAVHLAVDSLRKESTDDEIFVKLFGIPPSGKIEIVTGPMTVHIKIFDMSDYEKIFTGAYKSKEDPDLNSLKQARRSKGVHLYSCLVPELKGMVTLEKAYTKFPEKDEKATFDHEEHHALSDLFENDDWFPVKKLYPVIPTFTYEQKKSELVRYLRGLRRKSEEKAKEEILAYMKGRTDPKDTYKFLIRRKEDGGLYDYLDANRKTMSTEFFLTDMKQKGFLRNLPAKEDESPDETLKRFLDESIEQVFGREYHQLLKESIDLCAELKEKGVPEEKIVGLLMHEPLNHWKKLVGRLTLTK